MKVNNNRVPLIKKSMDFGLPTVKQGPWQAATYRYNGSTQFPPKEALWVLATSKIDTKNDGFQVRDLLYPRVFPYFHLFSGAIS